MLILMSTSYDCGATRGPPCTHIALINAAREAAYEDAIPAEVRAKLDAIDAEFTDKIGVASAKQNLLVMQIKEGVISLGQTVRGRRYMGVFVKASEKINMAAFKGYALSHPEATALVDVGEPTVQIRIVR